MERHYEIKWTTENTAGVDEQFLVVGFRVNSGEPAEIAKQVVTRGQRASGLREYEALGGPGYFIQVECIECDWTIAYAPR
jgi:hypothetical protein